MKIQEAGQSAKPDSEKVRILSVIISCIRSRCFKTSHKLNLNLLLGLVVDNRKGLPWTSQSQTWLCIYWKITRKDIFLEKHTTYYHYKYNFLCWDPRIPVHQFDMPNSYDFKSIGLFHINFCSLLYLLTKLVSMFACSSKSNRPDGWWGHWSWRWWRRTTTTHHSGKDVWRFLWVPFALC